MIQEEDTTEEDPLSDTILNTTFTLEVVGAPVKKKKIEEDEQITVKEELEDEDCDLESKIEVVDDMLAVYKTESADLTEFLEDNNEDPATEDLKSVEETVVKKKKIEEKEKLYVEDCDLESKIEIRR